MSERDEAAAKAIRAERRRTWRKFFEAVAQFAALIAAFINFDHPARFGEFIGLLALMTLVDIREAVREGHVARRDVHDLGESA